MGEEAPVNECHLCEATIGHVVAEDGGEMDEAVRRDDVLALAGVAVVEALRRRGETIEERALVQAALESLAEVRSLASRDAPSESVDENLFEDAETA